MLNDIKIRKITKYEFLYFPCDLQLFVTTVKIVSFVSRSKFLNQNEETVVQLEFECRKQWRASDHRRGKHIGRRGNRMPEERISSALRGSRFAMLESSSIVPLERSKEALSTDSAMHFRDNRITGTV